MYFMFKIIINNDLPNWDSNSEYHVNRDVCVFINGSIWHWTTRQLKLWYKPACLRNIGVQMSIIYNMCEATVFYDDNNFKNVHNKKPWKGLTLKEEWHWGLRRWFLINKNIKGRHKPRYTKQRTELISNWIPCPIIRLILGY